MDIIKMTEETSFMCGQTVAVVSVLPVCASFIGSDDYFDYWRGVDGIVYAM